MNMTNYAEAMHKDATRIPAPSDNSLEQVAAEARAHNADRWMMVQQAQEGMRVGAEIYGELAQTKLYRLALLGTYLFLWAAVGGTVILIAGNVMS
ncbi:MAG: hypothetical protein ACFBWO_13865 [Paracoccaceae bacterium]